MTVRTILPGLPHPLGATPDIHGTQFALFSRHADSVSLILFESTDPDSSFETIELDPVHHKTGDIWHVWISGVVRGQLYAYRIDGPYEPEKGHRFNRHKLLLDPYTKAVTGNFQWDLSDARGYDPSSPLLDLSFSTAESYPGAPKCIVVRSDYRGTDRPLKRSLADTVIYELHVRGFTHHPSSAIENRGTFRGIVEKIPHLLDLGVNAIELMPIQEFDETENINTNPLTGEKLKNYWGYSTISFFAPRGRYAAAGSMGEQVGEFREMVRALHAAGIEVILDVVFNHTAEGDEFGPTLCFRGIDNSIYYMLEDDRRRYKNYSGCGNTFNCNHPIVRSFIIDCLKYWVMDMHVDGFRFDLASILGRDQKGNILSNPPLLEWIAEDPILRNTKIIAEAWDAAGAYQVGSFPGRWAEWNGKYRDDVRKFWRGDPGMSGPLATRLCGSSDLYWDRSPLHSINFITCHDGFTMNDLVTYRHKHNLANGEDNRDGENHNCSANYGIEGPSATPYIESIRTRQIKNMIATLFLSQGVPMMLAGDEFRRTQMGNNNAYCQDNEISWIDWGLAEHHGEILRFTKEMIRLRMGNPALRRKEFFTGAPSGGFPEPDIAWHGTAPWKPDWSEESRLIACTLSGRQTGRESGDDLYLAFNASLYNRMMEIPPSPSGKPWRVKADTANPAPYDIFPENGPLLETNRYRMRRLSVVVLAAGPGTEV